MVAIRFGRARSATIRVSIRFCASLSAYRDAAVLFKLLDVLVAPAQPVPGLAGRFGCAAGFNAYGAEWDDRTAIEWSAHRLLRRQIAGQYAVNAASRAAGQKSQYWAKVPNGEGVHAATSTVDPAPKLAVAVIVSAIRRADTSSSLLAHYSTCSRHPSGTAPNGLKQPSRPSLAPGENEAGSDSPVPASPRLFTRPLALETWLIPRRTAPRPGPSRSSPVFTDSGTSMGG